MQHNQNVEKEKQWGGLETQKSCGMGETKVCKRQGTQEEVGKRRELRKVSEGEREGEALLLPAKKRQREGGRR